MRRIFGRWVRVGLRVISPLPRLKSWAVKLLALAGFLGYGAAVKYFWGWVNAGYTHQVFAATPALFLLMVIALYYYQKEIDERDEKYDTNLVNLNAVFSFVGGGLRLDGTLEIINRSHENAVVQFPEVELFCRAPRKLLLFPSWQHVPFEQQNISWQWRAKSERSGVRWRADEKDIPPLHQKAADFTCLVWKGGYALLHKTIRIRIKLDMGEPAPRTRQKEVTVVTFEDIMPPPPADPPSPKASG